MTAQYPRENPTDALLRRYLACLVAPTPERLADLGNLVKPGQWLALLAQAQAHGVLPLLHELPEIDQFCQINSLDSQPIRAELAKTALLDRMHLEVLHQLDRQLRVYDVPVLVIKGAALSLTHYRSPGTRPRVDTDLFIDAKDRVRWHALMREMGFSAVPSNFSSLVLPERSYAKKVAGAFVQLDVHWSVSSRPLLGKALRFSTLYDAGLAFDQARRLRMPRPIDALLVAIVHRLGHHRDHERYIWLYDIYLLWSVLSADERAEAIACAASLGLVAILSEALSATAAIFPMAAPQLDLPTRKEAAAKLLISHKSLLFFDLQHADWSERWLLLWQRLWAEPHYLRHRYDATRAPLCLLQLRRWLS